MDVAIPIIIDGKHVATFFTGQFFYDDQKPDRDFFRAQAETFGFDPDEYFQALEQVPVFSREFIRRNVLFMSSVVKILAETGLKNLKLSREKEERCRLENRLVLMSYALDHIREAAFLINEDGRLVYVNNEACSSLGYDRNELLNMCVADVVPDFPAENWAGHWIEIKNKGFSHIIESHHRDKGGRMFPVEICGNYFEFNGRGYHLALARNTTERKQMEALLRESEQQFRTLAENSPDIIIRYNRECRRIYANPAFARESGIAADLTLHVDLDTAWPAGTNVTSDEYKQKLRAVLETGTPKEILLEWRQQVTGQNKSHIFNIVAERNSDGGIIGCVAIGHNITKLRQTELRLAKLAKSSPGVLFNFLLRPDGTSYMPYASERIEEYGLQPEVMAKDLSEAFALTHPDDASRVWASISESAHTLSLWHCEYRVRHPDKGWVWVEGRATPELQPNGDILWSGFFHDITKRKLAEEALSAKQEQLASMAIDLSMAEERERRRIASELHDNIGQLLLLSRIKLDSLAGAFANSFQRGTYSEVQDFLSQTITSVRSLTQQLNPPLLAKAGLEAALEWLAQRIDQDYCLTVDFDDDRKVKPLNEEFSAVLFQSARELLINVAKHAGVDRARLSVARETDRVVLIVEDQGAGFTSLSNTDTDIQQNCSFGLFNIRQRIKLLGGEMSIKSEPGQGTRVTIHLPMMDNEFPE